MGKLGSVLTKLLENRAGDEETCQRKGVNAKSPRNRLLIEQLSNRGVDRGRDRPRLSRADSSCVDKQTALPRHLSDSARNSLFARLSATCARKFRGATGISRNARQRMTRDDGGERERAGPATGPGNRRRRRLGSERGANARAVSRPPCQATNGKWPFCA